MQSASLRGREEPTTEIGHLLVALVHASLPQSIQRLCCFLGSQLASLYSDCMQFGAIFWSTSVHPLPIHVGPFLANTSTQRLTLIHLFLL